MSLSTRVTDYSSAINKIIGIIGGLILTYSFYDWCNETNRMDLIELWDYELNLKSPNEIAPKSNNKYFFKCPRHLHESFLNDIQYIVSGRCDSIHCKKCESFAQYVIDNFGNAYLDKIWNVNNKQSAWEITSHSSKKVIFNCINDITHTYTQSCSKFIISPTCCPLCKSLVYNYPEVKKYWSCKNIKSYYDYTSNSGQKVWFKCNNMIHDDYQRRISDATSRQFMCPKCKIENNGEKRIIDLTNKIFGRLHVLYLDRDEMNTRQNGKTYWKCQCECGNVVTVDYNGLIRGSTSSCGCYWLEQISGANNYNWKGGITPDKQQARTNALYTHWRDNVYAKDWYTCQCCGAYGKDINKNAHHLYPFATYIDIRYDINNGITLCDKCHYPTFTDSFHNLYGTQNTTPEQLETYINIQRKKNGINIVFSLDDYYNGINILKPPTHMKYKISN